LELGYPMIRRLRCHAPDGTPIAGSVEFLFLRGETLVRRQPHELEADGSVLIPSFGGLEPMLAEIMPWDWHWSVLLPLGPGNVKREFVPFDLPKHLIWWRELIGRRSVQPKAGAGIRIGVVDFGFGHDGPLSHIRRFDIEGRPLKMGGGPVTHGYRVCKIIGERGSSLEREGVAPASEIVMVDVSDDDRPSVLDDQKVAPAIELLADQFGVHLINISAGAYIDKDDSAYRDVLLKSIRYARSKGALTIAAAGNEPKPPAMPARFDEVIAVGAIGQGGLAPSGTLMAFYEKLAEEVGSVGTSPLGKVFHYVDSCYGSGLDVVGPGIGVTLCYDDGIIMDYKGTSYAAPIVSGILACGLASNATYAGLELGERADFAQALVERMCRDTGLPGLQQGLGLPMLHLSN
jgi:subtilisin family serine protease